FQELNPYDFFTRQIRKMGESEECEAYSCMERHSSWKAERAKVLGFVPQREVVYNRFLPYSSELDDESNQLLSVIKANLGRSVMLREVRPGFVTWMVRLFRYVKVYGMKFSKDDHVIFVKLLYEMVTLPDLDYFIVKKTAQVLITFLKKRELLSPEDLQLPWRPLFDLLKRLTSSTVQSLQMILPPPYFPLGTTQEVLDEVRPMFCPFDLKMLDALTYCELFLPTLLPPEHHDKGFKLWFEEFMTFWQMCSNSAPWEHEMMWLMGRLAYDNVGYIDWEPYMPMIFLKLLQSFYLPVTYKKVSPGNTCLDIQPAVMWITGTLGGGSTCGDHLKKLFSALESYFHPANLGRWQKSLADFLWKLSSSFTKRLHRERDKRPKWEPKIPEPYLLKEEDIDHFVQCLLPSALLTIYHKLGLKEAGLTLHFLALLRPEKVIAPVVDKLYAAHETLTEPHRLTATMQCLTWMARSMMIHDKLRCHAIPLLHMSLPGIDPNDHFKCMITFHFISVFASLVTFVDCHSAADFNDNLSEAEQEVCMASEGFEEFVLQFLDKCFMLVESSGQAPTMRLDRDILRMNREESHEEVGLASTVAGILMQSSPSIFHSALDKIQTFIRGRSFEPKVSGRFIAAICKSAAKVNPKVTYAVFMPRIFREILSVMDSGADIQKEENLDESIIFNLLLLTEIARTPGSEELMEYLPQIEKVLNVTLHVKCKEASNLAACLLRNCLHCLVSVTTCESRLLPIDYSTPVSDCFYIRKWGKGVRIDRLNIKWHIPSEAARNTAASLVQRYLSAELEILTKFSKKEVELTSLESQVDCSPMGLLFYPNSCKPITFADGSCVRTKVAQMLHVVLETLLSSPSSGYVQAHLRLIPSYHAILFYYGVLRSEYEVRMKSFHYIKPMLGDQLQCHRKHIRPLLVERTHLQHDLRVLESVPNAVTPIHEQILRDLHKLSTSHYTEVRIQGQSVLQSFLSHFPFSYRLVLDDTLNLLRKDPKITHEQLKGALYLLVSEKGKAMIVKRDWSSLKKIWPTLVMAHHSEKPSITHLMERIITTVGDYFETFAITLEIPERVVEAGGRLWDKKEDGSPPPSFSKPTSSEVKFGETILANKSAENIKAYHELVDHLTVLLSNENLHWRFFSLGIGALTMLIRLDEKLKPKTVKVFVDSLNSDFLGVRKVKASFFFWAIFGLVCVLKQQKQLHKLKHIQPIDLAPKNEHPKTPVQIQRERRMGDREDNKWLQYNSKAMPMSREDWDGIPYVHKAWIGWYGWPDPMMAYAPILEQPKVDRTLEELPEEEKVIRDFFTSKECIEKLVKFLTLEERKDQDKFDSRRYAMFKGLFRNHGDAVLELLKPHLEEMVVHTRESHQRCAAEILAGLMRGMKHWPYDMVIRTWKFLDPLIRTSLAKVTPESMGDWGTCYATTLEDRDPRRYYWLLEILMDDPIKKEEGAFLNASRIYMMQGAICPQEWKVAELQHRFLKYVTPYLDHQFQSLRERLGRSFFFFFPLEIFFHMDNGNCCCLGRILNTLFHYDLSMPKGSKSLGPKRKEFVKEVLPRLQCLLESSMNSKLPRESPSNHLVIAQFTESTCFCSAPIGNDEALTSALNLLQTLSRWLSGNFYLSYKAAPEEVFLFLPILCLMENYEANEEVRKISLYTLGHFAQVLIDPKDFPELLATILKVAGSGHWKSKAALLAYMQVMVFRNLFVVTQKEEWVRKISEIVLNLMEDPRVEVRSMAGKVMSGLLHCEILPNQHELRRTFMKKSEISYKKAGVEALRARHAGVLGLCAFVAAYPYDVPDFMPDILMMLGDHLHDPEPIPTSIRSTLSDFKRTHLDNWQDHKAKFSDDQLGVLTDLLVSPSYYA
ncbi:unnamed protein product, partial [Darwinula stevensoni]